MMESREIGQRETQDQMKKRRGGELVCTITVNGQRGEREPHDEPQTLETRKTITSVLRVRVHIIVSTFQVRCPTQSKVYTSHRRFLHAQLFSVRRAEA